MPSPLTPNMDSRAISMHVAASYLAPLSAASAFSSSSSGNSAVKQPAQRLRFRSRSIASPPPRPSAAPTLTPTRTTRAGPHRRPNGESLPDRAGPRHVDRSQSTGHTAADGAPAPAPATADARRHPHRHHLGLPRHLRLALQRAPRARARGVGGDVGAPAGDAGGGRSGSSGTPSRRRLRQGRPVRWGTAVEGGAANVESIHTLSEQGVKEALGHQGLVVSASQGRTGGSANRLRGASRDARRHTAARSAARRRPHPRRGPAPARQSAPPPQPRSRQPRDAQRRSNAAPLSALMSCRTFCRVRISSLAVLAVTAPKGPHTAVVVLGHLSQPRLDHGPRLRQLRRSAVLSALLGGTRRGCGGRRAQRRGPCHARALGRRATTPPSSEQPCARRTPLQRGPAERAQYGAVRGPRLGRRLRFAASVDRRCPHTPCRTALLISPGIAPPPTAPAVRLVLPALPVPSPTRDASSFFRPSNAGCMGQQSKRRRR